MKSTMKALGILFAGALLSATISEGYYYLQVLRWVDAIRINQAIQQAAQQQTQHPQPPPVTKP